SQKEAAAQGEQADHRRKHAHRAILQILSSLVTQVLDFWYALQAFGRQKKLEKSSAWSFFCRPKACEAYQKSWIQKFRHQRRKYLQDGSMGVLPSMISLLSYAKSIVNNYSNLGSIFWAEENCVMVFKGARLAMDNFRAMLENAIHEAEDLLWLTLMSTPRETDRIELNTNNRLMTCRHARSAAASSTILRIACHSKYLRQVNKFWKLLIFCVHVTGGQSARGTEILSLRFKNGCVRSRNVFLLDGYVMTVKFYHKTDAQWDSPKMIPRFLPWRSEYLWASKSVSPDNPESWLRPKLTRIINKSAGQDLGQQLNTLGYRHVAVGIGRKFVDKHFAKDCNT
ncbi:hypothetical protein E4U17_001584, partial [Claviceps sp. LM77 group G4]